MSKYTTPEDTALMIVRQYAYAITGTDSHLLQGAITKALAAERTAALDEAAKWFEDIADCGHGKDVGKAIRALANSSEMMTQDE